MTTPTIAITTSAVFMLAGNEERELEVDTQVMQLCALTALDLLFGLQGLEVYGRVDMQVEGSPVAGCSKSTGRPMNMHNSVCWLAWAPHLEACRYEEESHIKIRSCLFTST